MAESSNIYRPYRPDAGFTLVEIAIVLVILGLIIAGATRQFGTLADNDRYGSTDGFLAQARQSLLDYVTVNNYLPCPDISGNGKEDRTGGKCDAVRGFLPYVDLGQAERSEWDAPLHYAVHRAAKNESCDIATQTSSACFFQQQSFDLKKTAVDSGDALQVHSEEGGSGDAIAKDVLAVVVSFGSNSFATYDECATGGRGDDERENCDDDVAFVLTNYRGEEADSPFDDQLVWVDELMLKSVKLAALKADAIDPAAPGGGPDGGTDPDSGADLPADGGDTGGYDPTANEPDDIDDFVKDGDTGESCNNLTDDRDVRVCNGRADAKDGNDAIYGLASNDQFFGQDGDDRLVSGAGNDTLGGGDGSDTLYGGWGKDGLSGDQGDDLLFGGDGRDTLNGEEGDDWLFGGRDNDDLNGQSDRDRLYGSEGNDTLDGGSEDDRLFGGVGNDSLDGGDDNDYLHGGPGADELVGGKGNDSFIYLSSDTISGSELDDIVGGESKTTDSDTDTIYISAALGTVTVTQSTVTQTVTDSLTISGTNVSSELFIDGVKWADFVGVERVVIGSP